MMGADDRDSRREARSQERKNNPNSRLLDSDSDSEDGMDLA